MGDDGGRAGRNKRRRWRWRWALLTAAALAAAVAGTVAAVSVWLSLKPADDDRLRTHRVRTNRVFGCIQCGREILPGEHRWICGDCIEEHSECERCYGRRGLEVVRRKPECKRFYREYAPYEVDPESIQSALQSNNPSLVLRKIFSTYHDRPGVGSLSEPGGSYNFLTYGELGTRCEALERSLRALWTRKRDPSRNTFVILYAEVSVEWYIVWCSCMLAGIPIVPIDSSVTVEKLIRIIRTCERILVVICSIHVRTKLSQAAIVQDTPIVTIHDNAEQYNTDDIHGTRPPISPETDVNFDEFCSGRSIDGRGKSWEGGANDREAKMSGDEVVMLLPTSGTTSSDMDAKKPAKLPIITSSILLAQVNLPKPGSSVHMVMYSYRPFRQCIDVLAKGGCIGVASGDFSRLWGDVRILRPTVFGAPPGVWAELRKEYESMGAEDIAQRRLFRIKLGNRCRLGIVTGAKAPEGIAAWALKTLGIVIIDGFGTTETGGLSSNSKIDANTILRLVDAPHYGFFTSDDPPRGEILARTPRMIPGYFKNPEMNSNSFVTLGGLRYFKTGDIGCLLPGGRIKVIGRAKSTFKLANGKFIFPEVIEAVYANCKYVHNDEVLVMGGPTLKFVHIILVASQELVEKSQKIGKQTAREHLIKSLSVLHGKHKLELCAAPRNIHIDWDISSWNSSSPSLPPPPRSAKDTKNHNFTQPLMTATGKKIRGSLQQYYAEVIPQIDTKLLGRQKQNQGHRTSAIDRGILSLISRIVGQPIGELLEISEHTRLEELGIDSVMMATLTAQARKRFNSKATLKDIANCKTISELSNIFLSSHTCSNSTQNDVDSKISAQSLRASVERESKLLEEYFSERTKFDRNDTKTDVILITGVTGFLGSYILKDFLNGRNDIQRKHQIWCLIRSSDQANAISRLKDAYQRYGLSGGLLEDALRTGCLRLVAGDLSQRDGLSELEMLGEREMIRISIAIHCGAHVNSFLPYDRLQGANVGGTRRILQMAYKFSKGKTIRFVHISTIGILSNSKIFREVVNIPPDYLPYLSGYAQSKWVAEQLVCHAEKISPTVFQGCCILRPGTIAGNSKTGAGNIRDAVLRLMFGLMKERMICIGAGSPLPQNLSMAHVDHVSEAVLHASLENLEKKSPNVTVRHLITDKFISLEQIADILDEYLRSKHHEKRPFVRRLPVGEFRLEIQNKIQTDPSHPLFILADVLASGAGFASAAGSESSTSAGNAAKNQRTTPVSSVPLPNVTRKSLHSMLAWIESEWNNQTRTSLQPSGSMN